MQKKIDAAAVAEQKVPYPLPPNLPANVQFPNVLIEANGDELKENDGQEEQYGKNYAESLDNHFIDRHTGRVAPELAPFCLNPEESRSYYNRDSNKKTWYDLCLIGQNTRIEPNKLYLELDANNTLVYTVIAPNGTVAKAKTSIVTPAPLTIQKAIELKDQILRQTTLAKHTEASPYLYYEGIPCANTYFAPQARSTHTVPEGHVGLLVTNGKYEFLSPGSHLLPAGAEFKLEKANQKHIVHGTMQVVTVQGQDLFQVTDPLKMDDFRILTQGRHVLELASGKVKPVEETNKQVLWVKDDEVAKAPKPESKAEPKAGEKPKEDVKVPAGRKPGRVIFVKVPQGKVGVAYDNEGQLRILKPGMCYFPPSWTFYDYISYKKNVLTVSLKGVKTKDDITVNVVANAIYQITNPYQAVREYGPNNIQNAIKDAASSEVKVSINTKTFFFESSAMQFDANLAAPAYAPPPPEYEENRELVARMNKQLSAGEVNISEVKTISLEPADPQVATALERATAARVAVVEATTRVQAKDMELQGLDKEIAIMRKRMELASLYVEHEKIVAASTGVTVAQQAVEKAKVLGNDPVALEVYRTDSQLRVSQNRNNFLRPDANAVNLHLQVANQDASVAP